MLPGAHPREWAQQFDLSGWVFFAAQTNGRRVGGATVASGSAGLQILEGRPDLAVLWVIRVSPEARGRGVGSMLFRAAERWAGGRGCRQLKVETQNINVPACKFYLQHGCAHGAVHRYAYPQCPEEIQLLWYKDLPKSHAAYKSLQATQSSRPFNAWRGWWYTVRLESIVSPAHLNSDSLGGWSCWGALRRCSFSG